MSTPQDMARLRWAGKNKEQRRAETQAARDALAGRSPEERRAQTAAASEAWKKAAQARKKRKKSPSTKP